MPLVLVVIGWNYFWCRTIDAAYTKLLALPCCSPASLHFFRWRSAPFASAQGDSRRRLSRPGPRGVPCRLLNKTGSIILILTLLFRVHRSLHPVLIRPSLLARFPDGADRWAAMLDGMRARKEERARAAAPGSREEAPREGCRQGDEGSEAGQGAAWPKRGTRRRDATAIADAGPRAREGAARTPPVDEAPKTLTAAASSAPPPRRCRPLRPGRRRRQSNVRCRWRPSRRCRCRIRTRRRPRGRRRIHPAAARPCSTPPRRAEDRRARADGRRPATSRRNAASSRSKAPSCRFTPAQSSRPTSSSPTPA